jgi:homocysteine S-methyltransferase
MPSTTKLSHMLDDGANLTLDGALATELEAHGCDLDDPLWSAKVLLEQPHLVKRVHLDYFRAGASVAITASYQATTLGFARRGLGREEALDLVALSVRLADEARREYLVENPGAGPLLVAGSVGPYGAYLADGSEYRGEYHLSQNEFLDFHRPRVSALVNAGADFLACETLPSLSEAQSLLALMNEFNVEAWLSFTLRDGSHISDGTPLAQVAELCKEQPLAVAIGVNCVPLDLVSPALKALGEATKIPLVAYPNSGESYEALTKTWGPAATGDRPAGRDARGPLSLSEGMPIWRELGARLIGGCCRTTPQDIAAVAKLPENR